MPLTATTESSAIEDAYGDQVKTLYKVLVSNLIDSSASSEGEKKSLDRFSAGLRMARKARELALKATTGTPVEASLAQVEHGMVPNNMVA
jgi:hypothetical protein